MIIERPPYKFQQNQRQGGKADSEPQSFAERMRQNRRNPIIQSGVGLFGKKQWVSPQNLKKVLEKDSGIVPRSFKRYDKGQRLAMAEELAKNLTKYRTTIYKKDFKREIDRLARIEKKKGSSHNKREVDHKIKYLKKLLMAQ